MFEVTELHYVGSSVHIRFDRYMPSVPSNTTWCTTQLSNIVKSLKQISLYLCLLF